MKKTLLTAGLIAFAFGAFAQFTANRLVVSLYSDAVAEIGKATSVTLKEFPLTGTTATSSLALPIANATGVNAFAGKGGSGTEGLLALSSNGSYLTLFGFNAINGATIVTGIASVSNVYESRVIARVDASGNINTTTLALGSQSGTIQSPRTAITDDGTGFWAGSSGTGGIRYILLGADGTTTGASVTASADLGAIRSINIFNGQLYETTTGSKPHFATISQGTNNLPKDQGTTPLTALTTLTGLVGSTTVAPINPNQAVFLKSTTGAGAPDVIYTVNDTGSLIEKYVLVAGTWTAKGTVATTGIVRGITGRIVLGTAYIYATTYNIPVAAVVGPPAVAASQAVSTLITISDALPLTSTITTAANAPVVLATAPTDNAFKGISFTPGTDLTTTVLPIKLSSFTGKSALNGVQLSWATSSEQNNNHFDILRSTDGKNFNKVGGVAGNGNSNTTLNYAYLDKSAVKGANYYKLNQVDNDGTSEEFGPVVVTVNGQPADLSVYANKASGEIQINIYANQAGEATLNIYGANGRVVASQNVSLQAGNNKVSLNSQSAGAGLHIASLSVDGITLTKKFVFQ